MKVGITGHQNLGNLATDQWVAQEIAKWLACHAPEAGYSSLAAGADQIFAASIVAQGIGLHVIVPCIGYDTTFTEEGTRAQFLMLMEKASSITRLNFFSPSEKAFWAAGRLIVENSDEVIAVWNGKPAQGLGGTGDVAAYALQLGKPLWQINPEDRSAKAVQAAFLSGKRID